MFIVTGVVVARTYKNVKDNSHCIWSSYRAIVECCNKDNGVDLVHNLKGIVVDWSSAQIIGVKFAFGETRGEELFTWLPGIHAQCI